MRDNIKISELRYIANKIFDSFELYGCSEFSLDEDYYWDVRDEQRYNFDKNPQDFEVGRLVDDFYFLSMILDDAETASPLMLIHLAPILRYMGLHIAFRDE